MWKQWTECTSHIDVTGHKTCLYSQYWQRAKVSPLLVRTANKYSNMATVQCARGHSQRKSPFDKDLFRDLKTFFFFIQWNQFNHKTKYWPLIRRMSITLTIYTVTGYSATANSDRHEIKHIKYSFVCIHHTVIMSECLQWINVLHQYLVTQGQLLLMCFMTWHWIPVKQGTADETCNFSLLTPLHC